MTTISCNIERTLFAPSHVRSISVNIPSLANHKEDWILKNWCFQTVVLEKTLKSPLGSKEIKPVNPKGKQFWIFIGRTEGWSSSTLVTWCEVPTLWKRPWCWERLKAGEEGSREWDGWMVSLTKWTWVWAISRILWRTGKHGELQFMRS